LICDNCKNEKATVLEFVYSKKGVFKRCEFCGASRPHLSDVYFKEPYLDEHLACEEFPGAKMITSKSEKKRWLEKCHLREGGDRVHGANKFDSISHRHAVLSLQQNSQRRIK